MRSLAGLATPLKDLFAEHLNDFEEVLPHLFLADAMRLLVADLTHEGAVPEYVLIVLDHLERNFEVGDLEIDELISTGFVEVIPSRVKEGRSLWALLGPKLLAEAERVALPEERCASSNHSTSPPDELQSAGRDPGM